MRPSLITLVAFALMAFGAVFVFSASAGLNQGLAIGHQGLRQLLLLPVAIIIMVLVSKVDYKVFAIDRPLLRSATSYILVASSILLILVLVPGIGIERNAARRWLFVGLGPLGLSFQPSELGKWAVIFLVVAASHRFGFRLHSLSRHLLPLLAICGVIIGLILIEDFGTAAFIALAVLVVLIPAGARWGHLALLASAGALVFGLALVTAPYRVQRLVAFTQPDRWAQSVGYQADQSLIAIASGGILGKGLGNGVSKYGHLPEDTTDFVFAVIAEELGLVGALAVIALFAAFIWLGLQTSLATKEPFGRLLAFAITAAIGLQAVLNIGVVTVVLPTKGIPLPFISGGGTSLLVSAAVAGVLLNIAGKAHVRQV